MFGEYLKKYRIANNLTQSQAAAKLNLLGGDLSNIDTVTFSRWERGITKPTISRSIRVLREFSNNLEPYLSDLSRIQRKEISSRVRIEEFDMVMNSKYRSLNSLILRANYQAATPMKATPICECPIGSTRDSEAVNAILQFHEQTSDEFVTHGLNKIDFLDYCRRQRLIAYKYIDNSNGELIGHNVGAIFTPEIMLSELNNLNANYIDEIDLKKTTPYGENRRLAYYAISQHSLNERAFRLQLYREIKFLASHANITEYYAAVVLESSVQLLEKMGFSVVAYENKSETGAIKIGKNSYSKALMHIEMSQFFSQPEILNLLTKCEECLTPCSIKSPCC
ncbi:helix-turn-helix domain-containing protein [Vibrio vulnificus]|uniref:helix-turn-helix domain-containing protein n=1 Tax=Vibrio vulnificus TaxID=672 RepID=UPI001593C6C8|nr:helix-turn-helix transcriptional regulator [Vibrio vulnificus]EHH0743577.1 helix-turn-helix transcriptional regulator [Vibrio vulnificus]EJE8554837.1 helix-turn-helix transcriptional regulator [Vibrio vulnificus]NVD21401.1 helix-turn-helix transcriptional regulator [Vibrio vulnificus]